MSYTIQATQPTQVPSTAASTYGAWALVSYDFMAQGSTYPLQFVLRKCTLAADGSTVMYSPVDAAVAVRVPDLMADSLLSTAFAGIFSAVQQYGSTHGLI